MGTPKDRLKQFIEYLGITPSEFERNAKIGNGSIAKRTGTMRSNTLNLIKKAYPELNINWVRTGQGEMIASQQSRSVRDVNGNSNFIQNNHSININELKVKIEDELAGDIDVPLNVRDLQNEVVRLRHLLAKAEKEIARLEGRVEQQNETIKLLIGK